MVAPVEFESTLYEFWVRRLLPIGLRRHIFKINNFLFNKPALCSIWFLWWWPISGVFYTGFLTSSSCTLEKKFGGYISANIPSLLVSPSAFSRTWDRLSIKLISRITSLVGEESSKERNKFEVPLPTFYIYYTKYFGNFQIFVCAFLYGYKSFYIFEGHIFYELQAILQVGKESSF